MENIVLEVKDVTKKYKKFTLENVNFSINEGKIVGFIGENGAGKSTTIKAISDLIGIDSGEILVFGKALSTLDDIERSKIAVVLDELCFPDTLRIKALEKMLKGIFKYIDLDTLNEYIEKFNLNRTLKIKELSKGMKAKLNLAIALSHKAKLLVLDEPTNGLDPIFRDEFLDYLETYVRENYATVLISSHIISDLERICDEFVFIHEGKIILNDTKENIYENYFIVDVNDLDSLDEEAKSHIYKYKKKTLGYDILVDKDYPGVDKTQKCDIEQIMVLMVRGSSL